MIKSIENAEHYNWGNDCDAWHLHQSVNLSVIQERMPAGTSEQLHYHHKSQQVFFMLSGTGHIEMEGKEFVVKAHESIHVPPMTKHKISNMQSEELHFLIISEPESHGDRVNV